MDHSPTLACPLPHHRWGLVATLFCLLFSACATNSLPEAGGRAIRAESKHDLTYRHSVTLSLKQEGGKLRLTSDTHITATYLSRRSTDKTTFSVAEPFFAPISKMEAWLDGALIDEGQISKTLPDHDDVFISDAYVHKIRFKRVRRGQTISYRYGQTYKDLVYAPVLFVPNIDRVSAYDVTISHPRDVRVGFELFSPRARLSPAIRRSPSRTRLSLAGVLRKLPLTHFHYNGFNLAIWPRFSRGGRSLAPVGEVEFVHWYHGLLGTPPVFDTAQLKLIQRLAGEVPDEQGKVKALYDFVRREVRYIADERDIGCIAPSPPPQVLRRRYGDCKDKAYLLANMARQRGIPIQLVLVGSDEAPPLSKVHVGLFNHVIAVYSGGGEPIFLDPTCAHCEFGNLPEGDVGKRGLILDPTAPRGLTIPAPPHRPSLELEVTTDAVQPSRGSASLVVRNGLFHAVLEMKRTEAPSTMLSKLATRLSRLFYNIELRDLKLLATAEDHARFQARVDLEQFLVRSQNRLYLPRIPFRTVSNDLLERSRDGHPLFLGSRPYLTMQIKLSTPGYSSGGAATEEFNLPMVASFSAQMKPSAGGYQVSYRFQQSKKQFEGPGRVAFLGFCKQYLNARRKMFVLRREAP